MSNVYHPEFFLTSRPINHPVLGHQHASRKCCLISVNFTAHLTPGSPIFPTEMSSTSLSFLICYWARWSYLGAFLTELKFKFFMLRHSPLECPLACYRALASKVGPLNECFNKPLWFYPHSDTLQLGLDHLSERTAFWGTALHVVCQGRLPAVHHCPEFLTSRYSSLPLSAAGRSPCLLVTLPGFQLPCIRGGYLQKYPCIPLGFQHQCSAPGACCHRPPTALLLGVILAFELNCFRSGREGKGGEKTEDWK